MVRAHRGLLPGVVGEDLGLEEDRWRQDDLGHVDIGLDDLPEQPGEEDQGAGRDPHRVAFLIHHLHAIADPDRQQHREGAERDKTGVQVAGEQQPDGHQDYGKAQVMAHGSAALPVIRGYSRSPEPQY